MGTEWCSNRELNAIEVILGARLCYVKDTKNCLSSSTELDPFFFFEWFIMRQF